LAARPGPDPTAPAVGSLRWLVTIAQRAQSPDPNSAGIAESFRDVQDVWADIQPLGPLTFYAGMQVDTPVTHRVTIRFLDWLDTTYVIVRRSTRPDGTVREEIFRIRRVMDLDGRKRFTRAEVELEQRA
jgi:head-tail adaptor